MKLIYDKIYKNNFPDVKNGTIFGGCKFISNKPIEIFKGVKNLIFGGCQFKNIITPKDAKAAYYRKNLKRKIPSFIVGDNSIFLSGNFHQLHPNTEIFKGKKGLKFIDSNCMNCKLPTGTVFDSCLTVQKEIEPDPIITDEENIKTELENLEMQYGNKAKTEAKKYFNLSDVKAIE